MLVIELNEGKPIDSIDLKEGIILHLDNKGNPLEIEILDASKVVLLDEFSVIDPIMRKNKDMLGIYRKYA